MFPAGQYCNHKLVISYVFVTDLFLWSASIGSALDGNLLDVHLKPAANITVCEGTSFQINCTWTLMRGMQGKVSWHFNPAYNNCDSREIGEKSSFSSQENNNTLSTFKNAYARITDSGWYFCKVTLDIPILRRECSNGLYILIGKYRGIERLWEKCQCFLAYHYTNF